MKQLEIVKSSELEAYLSEEVTTEREVVQCNYPSAHNRDMPAEELYEYKVLNCDFILVDDIDGEENFGDAEISMRCSENDYTWIISADDHRYEQSFNWGRVILSTDGVPTLYKNLPARVKAIIGTIDNAFPSLNAYD